MKGSVKGMKVMAASMAAFLTITSTVVGVPLDARAEGSNRVPDQPTELKTEMLEYAYGLNTKNPAFSWVVNDKDKGEVQTAYRIVVSSTSALSGDVLDTGWVESSESSFVHADALSGILEDNELYYWQVQTRDKAGAESPLSEARPFMTGIGTKWQSLNGIWATPNAKPAGEENLWADYVVEQTVNVKSGDALGLLLRMDANNSGYMAQVRTKDQQIKLHKINNKNVDTNAFAVIDLKAAGITLVSEKDFKFKVDVSGNDFTFWIDENGGAGYQKAGTANIANQGGIASGKIGYRTGRFESGTIRDLTVTGKDGTVLCGAPYANGQFTEGCEVTSDGAISVKTGAFSVYSDDEDDAVQKPLTEISRFSFFRSPRLDVGNVEDIDKAIVSSACRGTGTDRGIIYDIWMNGECLGAGSARELKGVGSYGGTSNYRQVYYNSYDVTDLLVSGDANVISALGNSRDGARSILVQMTVFYKDGMKKIVTNSGVEDSGWKTLDGTNAFGDDGSEISTGYVRILHDNVNMEHYPVGWQQVDYDDRDWAPAKVTFKIADAMTGTNGNVLYPFSSENVLRLETDEPNKKVYLNNSGNVVIDLGKEIIGGMRVDMESAARQKVTVHMGEEMNGDGTVKWKLSAVPHYEDTWTLVEGANRFETATMRNFRYVELIGLDEAAKQSLLENPDSIKGWAMQQPFDETDSSFAATDGSEAATLLNRLYELSKYTIKATNQDVFVDSQARERAPYEGDLLVNSNTSYAVSGNYSLARHSNEWLMDNQTWPNDYRIFSVEMAYWDYIYTGNTDSIRECYSALKNKMTAQIEYEDAATGLIYPKNTQAGRTALIDWPTSERDGYQGSYYDVVLNAEYVGVYHDMALISEALGQAEDALYYQGKSDKLKETLLKYAYDQENGCFYDSLDKNYNATRHSSTHATAYALNYGVYENQAMADRMCEFVYNKCKDEFKGSVYVTYFILEGLYRGNHGEMAEAIMTNPKVGTDVKTFASLLDNLYCTITPEAWGHKWKGNMTMSHPWGAAPGCSIVQGMFGILPTTAGFDTFQIKLQPGEIASAEVVAPTVKGAVSVSYKNGDQAGVKDGKIQATVTIPANTKAKVYLPIENVRLGYLLVDGERTEAVNDGKYLSVELGSGTYQLAVDPTETGYRPELKVVAFVAGNELVAGDTVAIETVVTDQFNKEVNENLTFVYESTDESVVKVDEDGVVTAVGVGGASVIVKVKYGVADSPDSPASEGVAQVDFNVTSVLTGFAIRLDGGAAKLKVGESAQARLVAIYAGGAEEEIDAGQVTFVSDDDVVSVDENGLVTRLKEGDVRLRATTAAKLDELNPRMGTALQVDEAYVFDKMTSPLNGVSVKDGNLYAGKSARVVNTEADKQGNVVSGVFVIEEVAANVAFNAADNDNRYFWQFRADGSLKKHYGQKCDVIGEAPIQLKEGENRFCIATVNEKIYTWLNGALIDICDVVADAPKNGGFGVRNGMYESAYFTELSVGNGSVYLIETMLSSKLPTIETVAELDEMQVEYGTAFENLGLPMEVEVTLSDGNKENVAVSWEGTYDGNEAGTYTLIGTLAENGDYENPNQLTAIVTVQVGEKKTEPENPENPTEPENPENPTEPENPENPTEPENPENPTNPENPERPTEPENPGQPTNPENPERPTEPENPGQPTNPENPAEPNNPGITINPPTPGNQVWSNNPEVVIRPADALDGSDTQKERDDQKRQNQELGTAADGEVPLGNMTADGENAMAENPATGKWAFMNLILMILTVLLSAATLRSFFAGKKMQKDEGKLRLASLLPAVSAILLFALTTNLKGGMTFVNGWTVLMLALTTVNVILMIVTEKGIKGNKKKVDR